MSVYWDHDIFWVPPCKKVPKPQYIVRPHGPKGTPGVRGEYDTFDQAHTAAKKWSLAAAGLYLSEFLKL